jgi:branched-chain amino acid transport system ATP-binding protein
MAELLRVEALSAGYGEAVVIAGLDLVLENGRSLAVLGRNGAGKTTLINALIGAVPARAGRILFAGADIAGLPSYRRARAGLGWCPQERNIFRSLSVEENLSAIALTGPWSLERVYAMFPRLRERRGNMGGQLSGGEQQMLAIGRALLLNPRLLLLDEPTEGLAPSIVDELLAALKTLASEGLAMIVVEQKASKILRFADDAIILNRGAVAHRARSADLIADQATLHAYLTAVG